MPAQRSAPEGARLLLPLAWANVAAHVGGLIVAWWALRPGSVLRPLAGRMSYLAADPAAWRWGWGLWMLCALLLVSFVAALRRQIPGDPVAAQLALLLTAAGMAVDLFCDALQIQALPLAASAGPELFLVLERLAFFGGLTVANGLYTIGVLLLNICLRGTVGPTARFAGWATVVSGVALAIEGVAPSPALLPAATGATLGFFCLWSLLVAYDLRRPR
jgi:hypothetical protein